MAVQRIWRKHNVQPHRIERHMISYAPDFEAKAAVAMGLHLNRPAHVAMFGADERADPIKAVLDCSVDAFGDAFTTDGPRRYMQPFLVREPHREGA